MPTTLTELDAARAYSDGWSRLDFSDFVKLLAPDAKYASQYVLEELVGSTAIAEYLSGKAAAFRRSGANVKAILSLATVSFPDKPCVLLVQGDTTAVVVFDVVEDRIQRFDLCITELYAPVPLE